VGAGHTHALFVHEHSRIHRLAPETKLAATTLFVFAVALTPRSVVWAFALYAGMLVAVAVIGRVPLRFVAVRLLAVLPFVVFAFLIPFIASGEQIDVLGVSISTEGMWGAWNIIAKATIGATATILLAATTDVPDLLRGMSALRVPGVLTSIGGFMIRYLELVAEELGRMRVAMRARGYDPKWVWEARPVASSAGAMFIRSYERGERIHRAMLARGFDGTMPKLAPRSAIGAEWLVALLLPAAAFIVLLVAVVTR
jgi:cobalt/nickel transport system permease protein